MLKWLICKSHIMIHQLSLCVYISAFQPPVPTPQPPPPSHTHSHQAKPTVRNFRDYAMVWCVKLLGMYQASPWKGRPTNDFSVMQCSRQLFQTFRQNVKILAQIRHNVSFMYHYCTNELWCSRLEEVKIGKWPITYEGCDHTKALVPINSLVTLPDPGYIMILYNRQ